MEDFHKRLLAEEREKFEKACVEFPVFVCTCCHRQLFRKSVKLFKWENFDISNKTVMTALSEHLQKKSNDGTVYICFTCAGDLKKNPPKLPCQAAANNLELPEIPVELQYLNDLERRFISLRIPFMKLVALPRGKQFGICGVCINVPSTTEAITKLLPRFPEEVQVHDFKLKRKLEYKGRHMFVKIRPHKILTALQWL